MYIQQLYDHLYVIHEVGRHIINAWCCLLYGLKMVIPAMSVVLVLL